MSISPENMDVENKVRYEGYGSVEFGEPVIQVGGPTVVTADQRGNTIASMQVENVPSSSSIEEGMSHLFVTFSTTSISARPARCECNVLMECSPQRSRPSVIRASISLNKRLR
jgi:hypothetical protein